MFGDALWLRFRTSKMEHPPIDLNRVLTILPLSNIMESVWKKLNDDERRSLRQACRPLKAHCNELVTSTTVALIPGKLCPLTEWLGWEACMGALLPQPESTD